MNQTCQKKLTRFVKDLGTEHDAARKTILSLSAFKNALGPFAGPDQELEPLVRELMLILRSAMPDNVPLNHILDYLELDLVRNRDVADAKARVIQSLEQRILQTERSCEGLAEQGLRILDKGDQILLHAAGEGLIRLLVRAWHRYPGGLKVLMMDLCPEKTRQALIAFQASGLDFKIVTPDQMETCLGSVDKLFLGPLPVAADHKILAPGGTAELVRQCRKQQIPVYFFADTLYYARANARDLQARDLSGKTGAGNGQAPEPVHLDLMDHRITEIGEVTAAGHLWVQPSRMGHGDPDGCQPLFAKAFDPLEMISA